MKFSTVALVSACLVVVAANPSDHSSFSLARRRFGQFRAARGAAAAEAASGSEATDAATATDSADTSNANAGSSSNQNNAASSQNANTNQLAANNGGGGGRNRGGGNNAARAGQNGSGSAARNGGSSASAKTGGGSANAKNGGGGGDTLLETSTTLDPSVIQSGSAQDGSPTGQQVASTTSTNNFINFCATSAAGGAPLMNGTQTKSVAACNPIPMGMIVSQNNMPSGKFTNPVNLDTIPANKAFDITMKIKNLETGNFVNPQTNYFSSPAQLNAQGNVIGHSHFVIEAIDSLKSTTVTDPKQFAFFKGVDPPAVNGVMTVNVPGGLPAGTYRLGSMNAAANHQPVLAAVAQHGMFDDVVYFTAK